MSAGYDSNPVTAGTGLTRRTTDATFGSWGLFDSNGVIHPAGSFSGTTNRTTSTSQMIHIMATIAPAGGGISGTFLNAAGPGSITVNGTSQTVNVDNGRGTVTVTGSAGTFNADGGVGKFIIAKHRPLMLPGSRDYARERRRLLEQNMAI